MTNEKKAGTYLCPYAGCGAKAIKKKTMNIKKVDVEPDLEDGRKFLTLILKCSNCKNEDWISIEQGEILRLFYLKNGSNY